MLSLFTNCWKIPALRRRLLFTLGLLVVCRLAANVPCPGVDPDGLAKMFEEIENNAGTGKVAGMLNMFTGGALTQFAVASLGIMPYITASIIFQLIGPLWPKIEQWKREGESGFQKLTQWTRYLTLLICVVQGYMLAIAMENPGSLIGSVNNIQVVMDPGMAFRIQTVIILTCGTLILMWLGEQITEKGIGQGASLIITISIINSIPGAINMVVERFQMEGEGSLEATHILILFALFIGVTAAVTALSMAVRKLPIQYARARAGRSSVSAPQTSFFPLKLNYANVMPIIFASTLLAIPPVALDWMSRSASGTEGSFAAFMRSSAGFLQPYFNPSNGKYVVVYGLLVLFFCFFWVANQFNPIKIADDLKRSGAYVPGYRPGDETASHIDWTMTRVTTAGAVFLTIIAVLPFIFTLSLGMDFTFTQFFGGASLLIIVGVMLDTLNQMQSHVLTFGGYENLVKGPRIRNRRGAPASSLEG
ncbi:MAG: preprotein translocase subunit SecY [Lentisphaeria bacterium]|nr:preprotein translocase subunit SecY [Lentisphaeria bacterium]